MATHFILTGFGPFPGCADNPSARLIEEHLPALLASRAPAFTTGAAAVLEVSAEAAASYCAAPLPPCPPSARHAVLLHLGVAAGAAAFHLEACGYNESSFRVPDARGKQPTKERIFGDLPLGRCLETSLDLADICGRLGGAWAGSLQLSTDPGRYLCNYLYASSLRRIHCGWEDPGGGPPEAEEGAPPPAAAPAPPPAAPQFHALFVHIPLPDAIPLPRQAQFVGDLCSAIAASLAEGRVAAPGGALAAAAAAAAAEAAAAAAAAPAADAAGAAAALLSAAKSGSIAPPPPAEAPAQALDAALASLLSLGFEEAHCRSALAALGPSAGLDALIAHIVDPPEAAPAAQSSGGGGGGGGGASSPSRSAPAAFDLSLLLPPRKHKMVCIVRTDLGMSVGKVGSQVAHAVLAAYRAARGSGGAAGAAALRAWEGAGEKIVLVRGEGGEEGLRRAAAAARAAGLPAALCRDAGRTEVEPGSVTVCAVGPGEEAEVDRITGELRLL